MAQGVHPGRGGAPQGSTLRGRGRYCILPGQLGAANQPWQPPLCSLPASSSGTRPGSGHFQLLSVNWLHPPGRSDVATSFRMSRDFRSPRGSASTTRRHDPRLCRLCRAPVAGRSFHGDVEYQPTKRRTTTEEETGGEHPSDPRVTA